MKKTIIIIISIIIAIIVIGGYMFFNKADKEEQAPNENEQNIEQIEENETEEEKQTNQINTQNEVEEQTNIKNESNTNTSSSKDNTSEKEVVKRVSPSGFAGSSSYVVVLYSNKEVYIEKYDGNGYEKDNLISNDLVATNVEEIEAATDDEHLGEVIVKSGESVGESNFGWLVFE